MTRCTVMNADRGNVDTETCSKCGSNMIKDYHDIYMPSNPPQYPYDWRCGCGFKKSGGVERGKSEDEKFMERWNDAN